MTGNDEVIDLHDVPCGACGEPTPRAYSHTADGADGRKVHYCPQHCPVCPRPIGPSRHVEVA